MERQDIQRVSEILNAKKLFSAVARGQSVDKVQLFFDALVLARYRDLVAYKIIRTDTNGRISKSGGWKLDFGISGDNDSLIHLPVSAFVHAIPEDEKEHWLTHMVTLPVSAAFLGGLTAAACFDDGPIRFW